jgi:hypothetical protein
MEDERLFRFDLERYVQGHTIDTPDQADSWVVVHTGEAAEYDYDGIVRRYVEATESPGLYRVIVYGQYGASLYECIVTARTEWDIERRDLKAPAQDEAAA